MPLQPSNHTPEQRAAAVTASLAAGATLVGVAAAAAEGRLVHEGQLLEPFEVNVSTLKSWRSRDMARHRAAEVAAADPAAAVDMLEGRLAQLVARKLADMERRGARAVATAELTEMARALREIRALRHVPTRRPQGAKLPTAQTREQEQAAQAARWAADAAAA